MIWFSGIEIFLSLSSSVIYGAVFALFVCFFFLLSTLIKNGKKAFVSALDPKSRRIRSKQLEVYLKKELSATGKFFLILLYTLGYVLLSYYSLDGCVRIYTLLFSLLSLFVFKLLLSDSVLRLILLLFNRLIVILALILSIFAYPFKKLYIKKYNITHDE